MRRLVAAVLLAVVAGTPVPLPASAAGIPVQLRASDGVALTGALYDAGESSPGVVLVHMYTRSKDDWRPLAERLHAAGISALAVDLRGHGGSHGDLATSPAMALDVHAAVAYLHARVPTRPVAIVGASFGASLAVLAAADIPSVRGVVLVSPAADYRGVRLDGAVRKYGARAMLLIASSEDPYALRTVRGLVSDATSGREQRLSSVAAHGTILLDRDPDVASALVDWLRRTLS
jgi:pimeloyl-ACP methyl ester carboxylesterase